METVECYVEYVNVDIEIVRNDHNDSKNKKNNFFIVYCDSNMSKYKGI
jgi:hypothetical protein